MKFPTLVADPPWSFKDKGSRISPDPKGEAGGIRHYNTLTVQELRDVAGEMVRAVSAADALLFLWAPHAFVLDGVAQSVAVGWGFAPKQEGVWVKTTNDGSNIRMGAGHYTRLCTEPFLICSRGRGAALIRDHGSPNVLFAPRGRHSEKPEAFYELVERIAPPPYLELYARRARGGDWTCWGDEL